MNFFITSTSIQKAVLIFVLLNLANVVFSQKVDSTKQTSHFTGTISATNNGVSLIPTFSLGKPALVFELSASRKKFSFDPQLRFNLENGKPWSFVFWMRYKLVQTDKFKLNIGTHPSFVFSTTAISANGVLKEVITTKRFWASELSPNYTLSKHVGLGLYYLYAHRIDIDATKNTHFLALNSRISNISLGHQFFINITPQVFYLNLDRKDGFYISSTLTLAKQNCPFTLSTVATKTIKSNIATKDFVSNVSLSYSF